MRLFVEDVFLQLAHQLALPRRIGLAQHLVVKRDFGGILVMSVILGRNRGRQYLLHIERRVDDAPAGRLDDDIEIAVAHCVEPRAGRHDLLRHLETHFAPLVDQPGGDVFVRLIDIAVEELEGEPLGAGLLQEAPRLGARFLDIRPIAGDLLQFLLCRRERRAGEDHAADRLHDRDLRQRRRAAPAVHRQAQGAAHAGIVEGFFLVVRRYRAADIPNALLRHDLIAKRADQLVARRGRHAAKLDRGAIAADRVDACRLLVGIDRGKAVEIGERRVVVIRVSHAGDGLPGLVMGEFERAGAENVLLVPVRILVEDRLFVDPVERVGDRRQEGGGREFEPEEDRRGIGRLDLVNHQEIGDARAQDALGRKDDRPKCRRDIFGGQRRAVVKFDTLADLEGVGLAAVERLRHLGAEIAGEIGRRGGVVGVDADQEAVEGRATMHGRKGALPMRVEARWRVGRDQVGQRAAALRRLLGRGGRGEREGHRQSPGPFEPAGSHRFLPYSARPFARLGSCLLAYACARLGETSA